MNPQRQIIRQRQHNHDIVVEYVSQPLGACVYMLHFIDTGKIYIGKTPNLGDRMGNHFNHVENLTYKEGLKNRCVRVYVLEDCISKGKASYKERLWINRVYRKYGSNVMLNQNLYKDVA